MLDPIEHWVPHRRAMCLLDALEQVDEQGVVARVTVPAQGLFASRAGVPAWVGIEYMAQAIAAWAGARARQAGGSPKIGFLLGSRRYVAQRPVFAAGARLRIVAECELIADNGLGMFSCRIECDGQEWATAKVSVFEPTGDTPFDFGGKE